MKIKIGSLTVTISYGLSKICETWTLNTSYIVQEGDPDQLVNTVSVLANPDGYPNEITDEASWTTDLVSCAGQIAPTGTTCDDYLTGMADDFQDYYAFQDGEVKYKSDNQNLDIINSVNPGVFFYYTGLSGELTSDDGTLEITIDQTVTFTGIGDPDVDVDGDGTREEAFPPLNAVKNDVKLYEVFDTDLDGDYSDETCRRIRNQDFTWSQAPATGDITIVYDMADSNAIYIAGVKYDTDDTLAGVEFNSLNAPVYNYNFDTLLDGQLVETNDQGGVDFSYDPPGGALTLDGTATTGGAALTQDQLAPVVAAAIDYWTAQGGDVQQLENTDIIIGNLGGTLLGEANDSSITLDYDAAGYGWSESLGVVDPNQVDLLSAVTHEFGHILGYDHDVMGGTLGVGERDLPLI
jgi:hypothetical protein